MVEKMVVICNKAGVHARPAAMMAQMARRYKSTITYTAKGLTVDGKNIVPITSVGMQLGTAVVIKASGEDEQQAVQALSELIESGFGE